MSSIPTSSTSSTYFDPTPLIPGWTTRPIPSFTLSAAGLLVLADLSTIAQRTALRGGSSWLDSLLLVPGLHYQQAADELARGEGAPVLTAVEDPQRDGTVVRHRIVNQAVVNYVLRIAKEGETVLLDVGEVPARSRPLGTGRSQRAVLYAGAKTEHGKELSWVAHLLYLASPALTCVAVVLIILLADWWALALVLALMVSRILNIFVIKSRSRPKPTTLPPPFTQHYPDTDPPRITQYTITLDPTTRVVLRGLSTDLYALTTTVWLRPKTNLESYLEAIAKILVYLVAAVSGNATQAGNLIMMALLLTSAGLLALSNAQVTGLLNGGRVVTPYLSPGGKKRESSYGGGGANDGFGGGVEGSGGGGGISSDRIRGSRSSNSYARSHGQDQSGPPRAEAGGRVQDQRHGSKQTEPEIWPETSETSSTAGKNDALVKARADDVNRTTYPSDDSVAYEIRLEEGLGKTPARASETRHR